MPEPTSKSVDLLTAKTSGQILATDLLYLADPVETDPDDFNRKVTLANFVTYLQTTLPVKLNKLDATAAPTTGDDTGDGYAVGSLWVNVTADTSYICVDATSTAAVWLRIDNTTAGPLNKLDATAAPTTGDDTGDGYSVGSLWVNVTADTAYICADATSTAAVWLRIDAADLVTDTTPQLGGTLDTNGKQVRFSKGADIAPSGGTLTLGTDGNYFDVTGTAGVSTMTALAIGTVIKLHFDAALTLSHGASTIVLPGGVDITTAANDEAEFVQISATPTWECTSYTRASGLPVRSRGDFGIACSDESTAITTGTGKVTFRMPYAMTLTGVRASVKTAPTGSTIIIDINEGGTTILSTKLSIDASEKTSTTAATAAVISDASLADDAEITIDFDQVGSTIAGAGVKVWLLGTRV